jgi:WD40 repeat protein
MMITGCADGTVRLLDMSNMTPIVVWKAHNEPVLNVSFSTDETTVYTLGADSQLLRWSVHSPGKVLKQYQYEGLPDKAQLADIAFEADGRYFIVPSKGQSAPIYHVRRYSPTFSFDLL